MLGNQIVGATEALVRRPRARSGAHASRLAWPASSSAPSWPSLTWLAPAWTTAKAAKAFLQPESAAAGRGLITGRAWLQGFLPLKELVGAAPVRVDEGRLSLRTATCCPYMDSPYKRD